MVRLKILVKMTFMQNQDFNMTLSKSLYTKCIQCPKALWIKKYNPSVLILHDYQASRE